MLKGVTIMPNELKDAIQEAFAYVNTIAELAKLYAEIQLECDRQLSYMAEIIAKKE
jgi:hypothetical protein